MVRGCCTLLPFRVLQFTLQLQPVGKEESKFVLLPFFPEPAAADDNADAAELAELALLIYQELACTARSSCTQLQLPLVPVRHQNMMRLFVGTLPTSPMHHAHVQATSC